MMDKLLNTEYEKHLPNSSDASEAHIHPFYVDTSIHTVACLLKAIVVKPAEAEVAREWLCKDACF
jgi:hypothetical protein